MPPVAPTVTAPYSGATGINPIRPVIVAKSPYLDTSLGSTAIEAKAATTDEGGDWTNPAHMRTGNGTQAQMASATSAGKCQRITFNTVNYSATGTYRVKQAALQIPAMGVPKNPPDDAGTDTVRIVVVWNGAVIGSYEWMGQDKYVGGTTVIPASSIKLIDITSILAAEAVLGRNFTVAQVEAMGTSFAVLIQTYTSIEGFLATWYVGKVSLQLTYYTTNAGEQESYQIQIASDSGFSSVLWDSTRLREPVGNTAIVPASVLTYNATLYTRAKVYSLSGTDSGYGAASTFTTLPSGAARLLTEPGVQTADLFEWYVGRVIDAGRWSKTAGRTAVYQAAFTRAGEPGVNWWLSDVQEEGVNKGYIQYETVAEVDAGNSRMYWDEVAGIVYMRTSDARHPGAFTGRGIALVLALPLSQRAMPCGAGDKWRAEPRVVGDVSLTEIIGELAEGVRSAPSGTITLNNGDGFFDTALAIRPSAIEDGWLSTNRRLMARAGGSTSEGIIPYAEHVNLLDGMATWGAPLWDQDTMQLQLRSRDALGLTGKLATQKFRKKQYPRLLRDNYGVTIPEIFGVGHLRRPAYVVDTGKRHLLRPGLSVNAVTKVYKNGTLLKNPLEWKYFPLVNHIEVYTSAKNPWDQDANYTWDGDGQLFEGSAVMTPGKAARVLLGKLGIATADIVTATYTLLDALWIGYGLRWCVEEEKPTLDDLAIVEVSGDFHNVFRGDGKVEAVLEHPTTSDATTISLFDFDLSTRPVLNPSSTRQGQTVSVQYWGYEKKKVLAETEAEGFAVKLYYGIDGQRKVITYHATEAGASKVAALANLSAPDEDLEIAGGMRLWAAPIGRMVLLDLPRALDPSGKYDNVLFQVRERTKVGEKVTARLRRIGQIDKLARPM